MLTDSLYCGRGAVAVRGAEQQTDMCVLLIHILTISYIILSDYVILHRIRFNPLWTVIFILIPSPTNYAHLHKYCNKINGRGCVKISNSNKTPPCWYLLAYSFECPLSLFNTYTCTRVMVIWEIIYIWWWTQTKGIANNFQRMEKNIQMKRFSASCAIVTQMWLLPTHLIWRISRTAEIEPLHQKEIQDEVKDAKRL